MVRRLKAAAGRASADSRPWYRVTAAAADGDGPARIDVYDEIGGSWFSDGVSAGDFVASLAAIPNTRALEVHINSPGGDVFDGIAIYNAIANRPGPVTTIVDGLAASAASFIAQAGKIRVVAPGSMMMIHDASGLCIGNAAEMRELAELLDLVSGNLADIYAAHAGKTATAWRDAMQAETWYKADQAVEAGLADKLAERPAPQGATAGFDLSVFAKTPAWLTAAAVPHGPMSGTHSHAHPAYGSQGGDATHDHDHSHDGDAGHGHGHGDGTGNSAGPVTGSGGDGAGSAGSGDDEGDGDCPTCKGTGKIRQGKVKCPDCDGTGKADGGEDDGPGNRGHGRPQDAGRPARVLGIESMPLEDKALPVHHTATVDETWDGPAAVAAMPADDTVLKYCHAWEDAAAASVPHEEGDDDADDQKQNYKFPHHKTEGGPANLAACRNGLARLSSADIPAGDDAGVKAHLQAHLDDGSGDGADDHAHIDLSGMDLDWGNLGDSLKGALK